MLKREGGGKLASLFYFLGRIEKCGSAVIPESLKATFLAIEISLQASSESFHAFLLHFRDIAAGIGRQGSLQKTILSPKGSRM